MKKEPKKPVYVLCPRCELNYINEKDKLCNVCKAELGLLAPDTLLPDEEEAGVERICPICHINLLGDDEEICFECRKEREEHEAATKEEDVWEYADDELPETPVADEMEILSLSDLAEEEEDDEDDDSEYKEPDDFDYDVDPDDFEDGDDEDDEDDEDDDF